MSNPSAVDPVSKGSSEENDGKFRKELEHLINNHSMENGSDTPDFILADYLMSCLQAFDSASKARQKWYKPASDDVSYPDMDSHWPTPPTVIPSEQTKIKS